LSAIKNHRNRLKRGSSINGSIISGNPP
jgi:hypothetical protein